MRRVALAILLALSPVPATADCALALILAVDVSGSIDSREFALQSNGLADAFETPSLASAIKELPGGMLAIMTHWSGSHRQRAMTGWHRLTDASSLGAFAAEARAAGRAWRNFSTAIGDAVAHAGEIARTAPETCKRRVIDVSGDGVSNEGQPPAQASAALTAQGFTINGLVIRGADPDPVAHYRAEVIGGPGAFVEIAENFEDYPRAILRKLLREIDQPMILSEADPAADAKAEAGRAANVLP